MDDTPISVLKEIEVGLKDLHTLLKTKYRHTSFKSTPILGRALYILSEMIDAALELIDITVLCDDVNSISAPKEKWAKLSKLLYGKIKKSEDPK